MKLRKISCVSLLFAFAWLWTYQLCDASEDAIENLDARAEIAAHQHASLRAPLLPDNDPDVLLAPVVDNTLMQSSTVSILSVSPFVKEGLRGISQHGPVVKIASNSPASPFAKGGPPTSSNHRPHIGHSNQPFVSSIQSNAPPAA